MRKNKGYQKEGKVGYNNRSGCSFASGDNRTIEQIADHVDRNIEEQIKRVNEEYEQVMKWTTLTPKEIRKHCWELRYTEVQFNNDFSIVPKEEVIKEIQNSRQRRIDRELYFHIPYQKRIIHKDNQKFVYNTGSGSSSYPWARIPSLKRSKATWKKFYELFPNYEKMSHDADSRRLYKLKKI